MMRELCTWFLALAAAVMWASAGLAEDAAPQYEDTFDSFDPAWGEPSESSFTQEGVMVFKPAAGYVVQKLYEGMFFDDADVSLRVRQVGGKEGWPAGLLFWGEDFDNFYMAGITTTGYFSVARRSRGKWLSPVPYRTVDAIKKGLDEWNQIRVVTRGKQATIFINGAEILTLKGQVPPDGSLIGMEGDSATEEQVTWEFDDLRVR